MDDKKVFEGEEIKDFPEQNTFNTDDMIIKEGQKEGDE